MRLKCWQGISVLLGVVLSASLYAHGYQYLIQVHSALVLNERGELSALEQVWHYDPTTTQLLIEGAGLNTTSSDTDLSALKEQLVQDLTDLAYFTELRFNGVIAPRERVQESSLSLSQGRLVLTLKQPLSPALKLKGELVIDMADPTGVGIPYHGQANQVLLPAALQSRCQVSIEQRQSITDLENFEHGKPAEWVKINCAE